MKLQIVSIVILNGDFLTNTQCSTDIQCYVKGTGPREEDGRRGGRGRRDDPRRHTLSGDHHHNYPTLARSMDLEVCRQESAQKTSYEFL